jgi:hypothetical protein
LFMAAITIIAWSRSNFRPPDAGDPLPSSTSDHQFVSTEEAGSRGRGN